MTKPLEIVHRNFQIKIEQIDGLFRILDDYKIEKLLLSEKFQNITNDFETQTLEILGEYYQSISIEKKCQNVEKYMQIVISKNFLSSMNQIIVDIKSLIVFNKIDINTNMIMLFKTYESTPIDSDVSLKEYTLCNLCKTEMIIFPAESEMRCPNENCSFVVSLKGMTFDDTIHSSSDANSIKRGSYETSRHCKFHLDRIMGIKNPNIPQRVLDKIEDWLKTNGVKLRKTFRPKMCRRCLKDIKETQYNEFVPYICQKITGISPERLFQEEINLVIIYFDKAATAFKEINGMDERANLKYYPFFIFKILETILNEPKDKERLMSIVENIHFQQEKTIISNDKIWDKICEKVPELKFKKTDTNMIS